MVGSAHLRRLLLCIVLAHALAMQAVLPAWSHLLSPMGVAGGQAFCRWLPTDGGDGSRAPVAHHGDCLAICLSAASTGTASPAAGIVQTPARFTLVAHAYNFQNLIRLHFSDAFSARGPPSFG